MDDLSIKVNEDDKFLALRTFGDVQGIKIDHNKSE